VNHTCFPNEDHLPDWACRDKKVTKGDRADYTHSYTDSYTFIYKKS